MSLGLEGSKDFAKPNPSRAFSPDVHVPCFRVQDYLHDRSARTEHAFVSEALCLQLFTLVFAVGYVCSSTAGNKDFCVCASHLVFNCFLTNLTFSLSLSLVSIKFSSSQPTLPSLQALLCPHIFRIWIISCSRASSCTRLFPRLPLVHSLALGPWHWTRDSPCPVFRIIVVLLVLGREWWNLKTSAYHLLSQTTLCTSSVCLGHLRSWNQKKIGCARYLLVEVPASYKGEREQEQMERAF